MTKNDVQIALGAAFLVSCATAGVATRETENDDASPSESPSPPPAPTCVACDGGCVDVQSDPNNCGGCGITCPGPCEQGACAPCVPCNGACIDEQNDPNNCGGCGITCPLDCQLGRCIVQVAGGAGPGSPVVDEANANLYWLDDDDAGAIMRLPLDGGAPVEVASGFSFPTSLALDGQRVYWTTLDQCDPSQGGCVGSIMAAPLGGGSPVTIATGVPRPTSIAVDATSIYWVASNLPHAVMKMPVDGGPMTRLFMGQISPGASDVPESMLVDGPNVYWIGSGVLASEPVDGGAVTMLTANQSSSGGPLLPQTSFTIQDQNIYWTGSTLLQHRRAPFTPFQSTEARRSRWRRATMPIRPLRATALACIGPRPTQSERSR